MTTQGRLRTWAFAGVPAPGAVLYAALLFLPFTGITTAAKTHKYLTLADGAWLPDWLAVIGVDVLVALGLVLVFALLLSVRRALARFLTLLLLHLLAPVLAAAAVFEQGFFSVTGAVLDANIVVEYAMQLGQVKKVIASEIDAVRAVSLAAPFGFSLLVFLLSRMGPGRRVFEGMSSAALWSRRPLGYGAALTGAVVVVVLGMQARKLDPMYAPLADNFAVGITRDLVLLGLRPTGENLLPDIDPVTPVSWTEEREPKAKNLVTIVLESVGAKRTGVYNDGLETTPYLKSLAKRGAVVDEAYTVVPHTTKALISIHCGVYPKLDPRTDEATAAGIPAACLADVLREHGFATAYFQSAEENYERRQDLVRQFGFAHFTGKESLTGEGFDESNYFGFEDDVLVEPVLEWVDGQTDRFYLSVLSLVAHHPYNIPAGFPTKRYAKDRVLNEYLNTVAYTDRFVKKLMDGFEARGLLDDTLFVIVGDHGEAFREHGRSQHDSILHEEGIHVPFLLVGPGIEPGSRIEGPRQLTDVLPTALEHLGFVPDDHEKLLGRSVLTAPPHEQLFYNCHFRSYCMALRQGDRKLIYNYRKRGPEIYDLASDPLEKNDLYVDSGVTHEEMARAIGEMNGIRQRTMAEYEAQRDIAAKVFVKRERPDSVGRPLDLDFDGAVRLIGWDLDRPVIVAGQKAVVTLYYEVLESVPLGWRPFLHFRGPQLINGDHVPVEGAYPVGSWQPGDFVIDRHTVTTRPLYAAGDYEIFTGFGGSGRVVPTGSGADVGKKGDVHLGTLKVIKPPLDVKDYVTTRPPEREPDRDVRFGDVIRLRNVDVDRPRVKGGLKTVLTFLYETLRDPGEDYRVEVHIDGPSKKPVAKHVPLNGGYAIERWREGQYVTDPFEIVTHTADRRALYRVRVRIVDDEGEPLPAFVDGARAPKDLVEVGSYTVIAD